MLRNLKAKLGIAALILAALFVLVAGELAAQPKPKTAGRADGVSIELRTQEIVRTMDVPSAAASTDITAGVDGVIFAVGVNTNATPARLYPAISALPYAAKLDVKLSDDANADTLVCTSVTIEGYNQFGERVDETLTTISETNVESQHCYEKVVRIAGVGCTSNSGDADDVLRVAASAELCLPYRIEHKDAILSLSIWDLSATELFHFRQDQLTVDLIESSVETDNLTPTLAAGDVVRIRVRPPRGL
jgi:hypothetical protein